jgi:Zn-dependent M28 family amino/carboxypeptidase
MRVSTSFVLLALILSGCFQTTLPGRRFEGTPPAISADSIPLRERLKRHVTVLAQDIGERNIWRYDALNRAADYVTTEFREAGFDVAFHEYTERGKRVRNIVAELPGTQRPGQIVIVGAHYDTVQKSPGADDNASGVAATIEVAKAIRACEPRKRTIRFVGFVNEESPFFWTGRMGSRIYAKRCRSLHENVVGMISLEMLGYYRETKGSQSYPPPFNFIYPSRGDFVCLLSNYRSRPLMDAVGAAFRRRTCVGSEGLSSAEFVVGHSDQWSFWLSDYKAVMLTDTAMFRNPNYHKPTDTPDTLDYDSLARVTAGVVDVVKELADSDERY